VAARGLIVWSVCTAVLLLVFMIFALAGWPGTADRCVTDTPHNTCYCEAFVAADIGKPGIRQKVNTLFNLYALLTSGLIALVMFFDRRGGPDGRNLMRSWNPIGDLYIFVVLFLGLGSMWFHASLMSWGGNMDGLSMYAYAAFLPVYSLRRRFIRSDLFFWIAYPITVVVFTLLHVLLSPLFGLASLVLIMVLVLAYLGVETALGVKGRWFEGRVGTWILWWSAVAAIVAATVFWILSQTGAALCDPTSGFQPHGLLWHPLAGVMAVLLYFYWREADDRAAV
jgi:hypothetical protein